MEELGDLAAAASAQRGDPEAPLRPCAGQPLPACLGEQLEPAALVQDPRPKDASGTVSAAGVPAVARSAPLLRSGPGRR